MNNQKDERKSDSQLYWESLSTDEKESLAAKCSTTKTEKTTAAYLYQVATGKRPGSAELANQLHLHTNGEWHREMILPHIFKDPLESGDSSNEQAA